MKESDAHNPLRYTTPSADSDEEYVMGEKIDG